MASGDGDKRKVTTDALETLGTIIDDEQKRDAIHLAVEPVVAGERLDPGDHVTVRDGVATFCNRGDSEALGIVDPFLARSLHKGERFWFVMYPRMVHSLRHVWAHPAFPDEIGTPVPKTEPGDEAGEARQKVESEAWLRNWCATSDAPSYDIVMTILRDGSWSDDYGDSSGKIDGDTIMLYGVDGHATIPPEFWTHAENVIGRKFVARPEYFSCSC